MEEESETARGAGGGLGSHWQEDWVLATIDSWVCSGRLKDDVVGKNMISFVLKELREAARRIQKGNWSNPNISILGEGSPDYSRIFVALTSKGNKSPVVRSLLGHGLE